MTEMVTKFNRWKINAKVGKAMCGHTLEPSGKVDGMKLHATPAIERTKDWIKYLDRTA